MGTGTAQLLALWSGIGIGIIMVWEKGNGMHFHYIKCIEVYHIESKMVCIFNIYKCIVVYYLKGN